MVKSINKRNKKSKKNIKKIIDSKKSEILKLKNIKSSRKGEGSLSVLTKKFIDIIKKSVDKTVDLNELVNILKVQKRRIYDVTNVLEGIGFIRKISTNKIKLTNLSTSLKIKEEINALEDYLKKLNKEEQELENENKFLENEMKEFMNNEDLMKYCYLTENDIKIISKKFNLKEPFILIDAPKETKVEVINPNENDVKNKNEEYPYRINLKSSNTLEKMKLFISHDEKISEINE